MTVGGRRVELDCLWRDQGVVGELDGAAAHASRRAFEADRARDAVLTAAGFTSLRFTWRRIQTDPAAIASEVARTLARAPRTPPPGCVPS
jgi:very-short-patch-repair endonuclease